MKNVERVVECDECQKLLDTEDVFKTQEWCPGMRLHLCRECVLRYLKERLVAMEICVDGIMKRFKILSAELERVKGLFE